MHRLRPCTEKRIPEVLLEMLCARCNCRVTVMAVGADIIPACVSSEKNQQSTERQWKWKGKKNCIKLLWKPVVSRCFLQEMSSTCQSISGLAGNVPKSPSCQTLVGGLVAIFYFPICKGNLIIPTDELLFFRGVAQRGPTTNQVTGWKTHRKNHRKSPLDSHGPVFQSLTRSHCISAGRVPHHPVPDHLGWWMEMGCITYCIFIVNSKSWCLDMFS